MARRLLDLVLAALGLVLLWPLGLVVALAIKLDSPGPVFFRQERVGLKGRRFRIHKFRTMVDAEAARSAALLTVAGDPRITRVGAWLRRYKVDELPQLVDVLRGAMSLVGPRPEVPRYVEHYPPALRQLLLAVRPGLTDPASLAYADENDQLARSVNPEQDYIDTILPAKLALSAQYLQRRTLSSDIGVLWATALRLARRGASSRAPGVGDQVSLPGARKP
jgi:lipopolysaccharide/colanic/teichoic acid biosynthesis glycosyltransferase